MKSLRTTNAAYSCCPYVMLLTLICMLISKSCYGLVYNDIVANVYLGRAWCSDIVAKS